MTKIIEGLWNRVSKNLETLTAEESESQKALRKVRNALKLPQLSAKPILISIANRDVAEKARRERRLHHLESAAKAHPPKLAKYGLERAGASDSEMDIKQ